MCSDVYVFWWCLSIFDADYYTFTWCLFCVYYWWMVPQTYSEYLRDVSYLLWSYFEPKYYWRLEFWHVYFGTSVRKSDVEPPGSWQLVFGTPGSWLILGLVSTCLWLILILFLSGISSDYFVVNIILVDVFKGGLEYCKINF